MERVFFISDLHFGHKNIIKYENRPYENTDEMDADLIAKWNSVVDNGDTVWFLGDLSLSSNKEYVRNIIKQLKGHKKMIRGNHDRLSNDFYLDAGFEYISQYPVILKDKFILSHAPMESMKEISNFFYIYGHVHGSPAYSTHTRHSQCVCCERQNYLPVEIREFNAGRIFDF